MRRAIIESILTLLVVIASQPVAPAKERTSAGQMSNLDRAIIFVVQLEAHANRLEGRTDLCVGFGHGLSVVDEKGILSELRSRRLRVHSNGWCNQGPRGLVISIIGPTTESASGTYELVVEVGDLRPIRQNGEHFATLLRRGTYTVKCKEAEPELVRYQEAAPPGNP